VPTVFGIRWLPRDTCMIRVFIGFRRAEDRGFTRSISKAFLAHASQRSPSRDPLSQCMESSRASVIRCRRTDFYSCRFSRRVHVRLPGRPSSWMRHDMRENVATGSGRCADDALRRLQVRQAQPRARRRRTKFLGAARTKYPKRTGRASCSLNNARCGALTARPTERASGSSFHQFRACRRRL